MNLLWVKCHISRFVSIDTATNNGSLKLTRASSEEATYARDLVVLNKKYTDRIAMGGTHLRCIGEGTTHPSYYRGQKSLLFIGAS